MLKPIEARYLVNPGETGKLEIPFDMKYLKGAWDKRVKITLPNPYVTVFVDEKATRAIPVREVLRGTPDESHIIEKIEIKPKNVKVTWLKSELARITEIVTEPIDVTDLNKTRTSEVLLTPKEIQTMHLKIMLFKLRFRWAKCGRT